MATATRKESLAAIWHKSPGNGQEGEMSVGFEDSGIAVKSEI